MLSRQLRIFYGFWTSDCNDFFLFALQTRIRFSAMLVVNWHFLYFFSSLLFCALLKTIPSAGTRKNYSETHFKLSERHHQHARYKRAYSIYTLNVDNVVYKRIDFCVRIFFVEEGFMHAHFTVVAIYSIYIFCHFLS